MRVRVFRVFFLSMAAVFLFLLGACPGRKAASNTAKKEEKAVSGDTFVIALLPEEDIFYQKRRYRELTEYLSKVLGMNVKTKLLDSYEAIYEEMSAGKVDAALLGGLSYVVMGSKIGMEPVARPVMREGGSTYRGVIFALRDKGITADVSSWRGKKIGLVSRSSAAGYLFPRWYLCKKRVKKFGAYFGRVYYMGSLDSTIRAVIDGKVDIGCSTDRILDKFLTANAEAGKKLLILATSGPFTSDTLGIRKGSLDARHEKLLKEAMLNMDGTDEGREVLSSIGADRFIQTRKSDYSRIYIMMKDLSLGPDFFGFGGVSHDVAGSLRLKP